MIKVGITGQAGFIGTHLYNTLGLYPKEFERIPFEDSFFDDDKTLISFTGKCDAIVHLAAVNRYEDQEVLYKTNIELSERLIRAIQHSDNKPHIIVSSSVQEDLDNQYGKSKRIAREKLAEFSERNRCLFTGLVFPNIFGPFGKPFYNSFVATFCHLLNEDGRPSVDFDKEIPLLYVSDVAATIISSIRTRSTGNRIIVKENTIRKVTEVLLLLENFKATYSDKGYIPELPTKFEIDLFNTFRSYSQLELRNPVSLKLNSDHRGSFVEVIKAATTGQFSFSTTKSGITRGNHFHTRKVERFAVIGGKALIELRRVGTNKKYQFELDGKNPSYVDMPIWYTHNITNRGSEELITLFWINEFFDPSDPDTFYEKV